MTRRTERINQLLRECLSKMVLHDLKDPRVQGLVTVTEVDVSPDLSTARVYVSAMGTTDERASTIEGLTSAKKFLQRGLIRLSLKKTPNLVIVPDDTMERADRMLRLIDEANRDLPDLSADPI
jgi:ribosome-binding factor A